MHRNAAYELEPTAAPQVFPHCLQLGPKLGERKVRLAYELLMQLQQVALHLQPMQSTAALLRMMLHGCLAYGLYRFR